MLVQKHRIAIATTAVLFGFLLFHGQSFFPYPFEFLIRTSGLASKLAILSAAFLGWGALVHRALAGPDRRVSLAGAWALGASVTATLMGFLTPIWYPNIFFLAPWIAGGVALLLRYRSDLDFRVPFERSLLWFLVPFVICALLLALAPPQSLDSLVYHLAIPKQFALQGHAFEMPWNLTSYFPQHAELLFGATLELDPTGILAQLLHLCAALLTLTVVVRTGKREFGRLAGSLAAVMLFSIPTYALIAGWAWNDWFVLLYAALALDQVLAMQDSDAPRSYLLAAMFLGSAAAVKYNALPLLVLLAPGVLKRNRRYLPAATLLVVALLAPWYGKNLVQQMNPVFPLFSKAYGTGALTDYRGETTSSERWLGYLGRRDMIDESIGLLWIAAVPLGLGVLVGARRRLWPLGAVAGLYLTAAVVFHPTVRAFGPLFLVGSWLNAQGIAQLASSKWPRRLLLAGTTLLLWTSLAQVLWVLRYYEPLPVALGFTSREQYLETGHDYHAAYRWIAENTEPSQLILVVGESRIFYLDRPAIASSYLDQPVLSGFSPNADAKVVADRLREIGVSHILLNRSQLRVAPERPSTTNELLFFSDPATEATLQELIRTQSREVLRAGPIQIFELSSTLTPQPSL